MQDVLKYLLNLCDDVLQDRLSVQSFCATFERAWTFKVSGEQPHSREYEALSALFDEVVLFSPDPRETWEYPKYRTADDIKRAVKETLHCAAASLGPEAIDDNLPKRVR